MSEIDVYYNVFPVPAKENKDAPYGPVYSSATVKARLCRLPTSV